jgi:hypothetical protein
MAIDNREKRQSAAWLYTGMSAPSVTPNATPDKEWRQQSGWGYSGIAAAPPGGPTGVAVKYHHYQMVGGL